MTRSNSPRGSSASREQRRSSSPASTTSYGSFDIPHTASNPRVQGLPSRHSIVRSAVAGSSRKYFSAEELDEDGRLLSEEQGGRKTLFSRLPANAKSRDSAPHSRRTSGVDGYVAANSGGETSRAPSRRSSMSGRSIRAPNVRMRETSPLAKAGIKGDGLMMFITCFISIGVVSSSVRGSLQNTE